MKKIPGIHSILYEHASTVWKTEKAPDPQLTEIFEEAQKAIIAHNFIQAKYLLARIGKRDLLPSQEMRHCYLQGMSFSDQQDYKKAYRFYDKALIIAIDYGDFYSRLLLTHLAGLVLYGSMQNHEAIEYFQEALDIWHAHSRTIFHPPIEPEITILDVLGKSQWNIRQFEEAHGTLARIVVLAQNRRNAFRGSYLSPILATSLWTLALVLRAQSDMLNGDEGYIHIALRRAKKAVGLYNILNTRDQNIGRLHVQIAELYLDLSELHFLRNKRSAARSMLNEGYNHAQKAAEILELGTSGAAKLLANLTMFRHDTMKQTPREALLTSRKTEARLIDIERAAANLEDKFVSAKAATLRAEWLIKLGEITKACDSLQWAIEGFGADGKGMATRAERLLRTHCSNLSGPEIPFGGYEKSRN